MTIKRAMQQSINLAIENCNLLRIGGDVLTIFILEWIKRGKKNDSG